MLSCASIRIGACYSCWHCGRKDPCGAILGDAMAASSRSCPPITMQSTRQVRSSKDERKVAAAARL